MPFVYHQDGNMRRRSDWSKWVSLSGTSLPSPSSTSMDNTTGECNKDAYSEDEKKPHPRSVDCVGMGASDEPSHDTLSSSVTSLNKGLSNISIDNKPKSISACSLNSQKHEAAFRTGDVKVQKVNTKIKVPDSQRERGFCNDFISDSPSFSGDQSTFLLDEELELEHAELSHDLYSHKR